MSRALTVHVVVASVALAGAGCGDGLTDTERDVAGAYALIEVNGLPLPFDLRRPCGENAANGVLQLLRESRFFVEVAIYHPDCPEEAERDPHRWVGSGLWTVIEDDVRFISDLGIQQITFGREAAPLSGNIIRAVGQFEVEGYEGTAIRATLEPVEVEFTFSR